MKIRNHWLFIFAATLLFAVIYGDLFRLKSISTHDTIIWYGSFHYFVESLINGHFPLWDPYTIAGTPFYQNIPHNGGLDPLVLISALFVKISGVEVLTAYIYMHLARLFIFVWGAYFLFKEVSGCRSSAAAASAVLLFAVAPVNFREGITEISFLTPFALYFMLNFFNSEAVKRKYLYLFLFILASGVTMNVFIPSYFLFNVITFFIAAWALGLIKVKETVSALKLKLIPMALLLIALTIAMTLPSLAIYKDSAGKNGELFPSTRIIQKNNGIYKKMVASDTGYDALSTKFTKQRGVYSSYGNILNLIYPDIWKYYLVDTSDFKTTVPLRKDMVSETFQFIGIIPFILALVGLIYSKNRFRLLAGVMLFLISVNLYSFSGVHNRPPNWLQEIFNTVFPFLKMIEVRETFSAFFLLYLCMLLCLGFKMFFNEEEFRSLTDRSHRSLLWVILGLIAFKAAVMFHVCRCFLYNSTIDLLAIITIAGFALFIFLYHKRSVRLKVFWAMALLVTIAELYNFNVSLRDKVVQKNWLSPMITENEKTRDKGFALSRYLFVEFSGLPLAFSEPIFKVKGAFSRGNNHHLFTTKRYYDYMTHVPLESQFFLSGMTAPILRFFPEGKTVILKDRREVLSYLSTAPAYALSDTLALERGNAPENTRGADGSFAELDKYEDMPSLEKDNINLAHAGFASNTGFHLTDQNIYNYMNTGEFSVKVESFSPNSLTVKVKNSVNGYLYYNDGWSKYWRAFDNGVETEVKPANYAFKAVFLKSGAHTVTFLYRPLAYLISLYAYFAALSVTVIVSTALIFLNRDIVIKKTTDN